MHSIRLLSASMIYCASQTCCILCWAFDHLEHLALAVHAMDLEMSWLWQLRIALHLPMLLPEDSSE